MSLETSSLLSPPNTVHKPKKVFHESVWGDYFITLTPIPSSELEKIKQRIDELKEVIKKMLRDTCDQLQSLELIDAIHHLGVSYHFELEINDALKKIHEPGFDQSHDLHITALGFRLLRQQRFPISADVFNKFLNKEGDFSDSLKENGKALLSLYEAAHLGTPSEKILENAADFARTHLTLMLGNLEPTLASMTIKALETPRFRRTERLEARKYFSIYEEEENRSEILLEFAKLDFQLVQSIHLEELRRITLWNNSIVLLENLPFVRDRLVELHFWMTEVYFEPRYSRARILVTKLLILITALDDIYDQYGVYEELKLLNEKIDRWDLEKVDQLPKSLQHFCMVLYQTFKNFEDELAYEQYSFRVQFLKNEMKKLAQAYFDEMQWGKDNYVPNIEEHFSVSLWTSVHPMITCASFVGMHEAIPLDVFEWIADFPEIIKASCIICRVMNDITSDEHEQMDHHFATIVQSYSKQNKCTKEEACKKLKMIVEEAWKTLNQEYLLTNLSIFLVRPIINLARVIELVYKEKDTYTNALGSMKDNIKLVMVEPILSKEK